MSAQKPSQQARTTRESARRTYGGSTPKHSAMATLVDRHVSHPSNTTDVLLRSPGTKKSIRPSDLMGAMYPGMKIGHKYCTQKTVFVPKTMGFLWNTEDTITGVPFPRGWRPGAIAVGVRKKSFRPRSITEPLSTPIGSKGKKIKKKLNTAGSSVLKTRTQSLSSCDEVLLPPTLYVQKEGGVYRVIMQPIDHLGRTDGVENEQPVQFKIAEDSASSKSRSTRSSSSSLKVEYTCTGALRKPIIKPEKKEMETQYNVEDCPKIETKKKEESKKTKKGEKKENTESDKNNIITVEKS